MALADKSQIQVETGVLPVVVVGAGIAGTLLASLLVKQGIKTVLVEQALELEELGTGLSVWPNAVAALDHVGLGKQFRQIAYESPLDQVSSKAGGQIRNLDAGLMRAALGGSFYGVNRGRLLSLCAQEVTSGSEHSTLMFGSRICNFVQHDGWVDLQLDDGSQLAASLLIGADGINSTVRRVLYGDHEGRYSGYHAWRGLTNVSGSELASRNIGSNQIWAGSAEAGYVHVDDETIYWFVTEKNCKRGRELNTDHRDHLLDFTDGWPNELRQIVRDADPQSIICHPIEDRAAPDRWAEGLVCLIGDAAHPMRPHLGQGACQAIEDAVLLAEVISSADQMEWPKEISQFASRRQKRVKPIIKVSRLLGAVIHSPALVAVSAIASRLIPESLNLKQLATVASRKSFTDQLIS